MTKKEICTNNPAFAYYNYDGFNGLLFHKFEYGIEDYIYCTSGAWGKDKKYHKLKIRYDKKGYFVKLHDRKAYFDDCIRTEAAIND